MSELRIVRGTDPRSLLEHAASDFFVPRRSTPGDPFPSPRTLLALRQGGLRDDLIRMAAERGIPGWFDPPLCVFAELPARLAELDDAPMDDYERLVLLTSILESHAGSVLSGKRGPADHVDAVHRFVGELIAEGVSPAGYDAALARCDGRDAFERRRDAELSAVYAAYGTALATAKRRDPRGDVAAAARRIAADPEALAARLGGRREIRIFGLQDLRGGWRLLLRALRDSAAVDRIVVYTSMDLPLADLSPMTEALDEADSLARHLFDHDGPPDRGVPLTVVSAPDTAREVEDVACRVRAAIDAGTAPDRIAVVTRQARPHVDMVVRALARVGVPATARRRFALREIPVVRALLSLFAAAADGWSRHSLCELAEQPYIGCDLDAFVLDHVGYRRRVAGLADWEKALRSLERDARSYEERAEREELSEEELRAPIPPYRRVVAAREALSKFTSSAKSLDGTRRIADWLSWLADMLDNDPFGIEARIYDVPDGDVQIARIDLKGWSALASIVASSRSALESWGGHASAITAGEFALLLEEMLAGDVAMFTETMRGVQVLEAPAAAYRSFERLYMVGLESGRFPTRPTRSPLFDDAERERLCESGLPLDRGDAWEQRERELFRILVAGSSGHLTLSHPRLDESGREVAASAFLDAVREACAPIEETIATSRVLTPRLPVHDAPQIAEHAARVAHIERRRATGQPSPYSGAIETPELLAWLATELGDDRLWSPTQLESYAKCPWSYLAGRLLRLEKLGEPADDMEPTVRGTILHDALHRFYDAAAAEIGSPVFLRAVHDELVGRLLPAALDAAIDGMGRRAWLGIPALLDAKRRELLRMLDKYVRFEIRLHEDGYDPKKRNAPAQIRTGVVEHELAFRDIVLDRGGVRFRFRGSIDRVEVGVDERFPNPARFLAAVDYKTTKSSTPGGGDKRAWDDNIVLQVPLYAYALSRLRDGAEVARAEYRALKQASVEHCIEPFYFDKKACSAMPDEDAEAKVERALDAVATHVLAGRGGQFPTRPAPSCGCSPYCVARDICRIPGGPREAQR